MISQDEFADGTVAATKAREILDLEFSRHLTLDSLARRLRYNRTDLQAEFKGRFAITIHQYVMLRRIQIAKRLLRDTEWKIEAIGLEVGYRSKDAFYRSFRKCAGVAPNKYRQVHRPQDR